MSVTEGWTDGLRQIHTRLLDSIVSKNYLSLTGCRCDTTAAFSFMWHSMDLSYFMFHRANIFGTNCLWIGHFPPRTLTLSPSMGNSATTVCVTADTECCAGTENRIACVNMMASLPWQTECFLFCGKQRGNGEGRVILSQGSDTSGAGSRTDHMT